MIMSISMQWYIFMGTRALALTEGLLTQLVFEHSLRIRFKAEGSKENSSLTVHSPTVTSETLDSSTTLESSDTQSDTTAGSTKGKAKADSSATKSATAKDEKKEEKKDNLVGKINTLVTVDLENVVSAKDFLMVGK